MQRYVQVKDLGAGNFGVAKLMKDTITGEAVAIKYIERGEKVGFTTISSCCRCDLVTWYGLVCCRSTEMWSAKSSTIEC